MKFLRYRPRESEKPGLLDDAGRIRDPSHLVDDLAGDVLADLGRFAVLDIGSLPIVRGNPRLSACVARSGKSMCIELNSAGHAAESGMPVPARPVLFRKATSASCGPTGLTLIPRGSEKTDWEVELGVVIGKAAKYVTEAQALDQLAGFCVINDVSERAWQTERCGQWTKGKSGDNFGPTGPCGRSARSGNVADGNWRKGAKRVHPHHGLRCSPSGQLSVAVHDPASGRHHFNRDAARRRAEYQPPALSKNG